jgi:hypothetical protein
MLHYHARRAIVTLINIPVFTYPFKSAVGQHVKAVNESVFQWTVACGLYEPAQRHRYQTLGIGDLACRAYPDATYRKQVLAGSFLVWLFVFDDRCCDEHEAESSPENMIQVVSKLLGILENRPHETCSTPIETGFTDFIQQLSCHAVVTQRKRFSSAVTGYLLSMCWEAANRRRLRVPELAEYMHMRFHSGAVPTCLALIDIINDFNLSSEEYYHPDVTRLIEAASNLVSWSNDIFSYRKEQERNGIAHGLPSVLQHQQSLEISHAMQKAIQLHDEELRAYAPLEDDVRQWASANLCRFLDGLQHWITANVDWSLSSGRYQLDHDLKTSFLEARTNISSESLADTKTNTRPALSA